MIAASLIPGFQVKNFGTALIGSIVVGLLNATLGLVLKILTLPITILTFGLFLLVINGLMLQCATLFVPGFVVQGFFPALFGALGRNSFILFFAVSGYWQSAIYHGIRPRPQTSFWVIPRKRIR
jgi:putative membrane protein